MTGYWLWQRHLCQGLSEEGFHVTVLDPSPASMRMTTSPKIYSTLEDSQLSVSSFDIIHIKDVLEHLPNKGTFFSSCSRVLRSPGIIMCVFNAIPSIVGPNEKTPPNQKYTHTTFDQIRTAASRSGILFDDELLLWWPSKADDDWYEEPLLRAIAIGIK
ncbi:methyltransferase domain-containing protein [Candidatus Woesebacteria bacterium]|nr:methyltransferase domain-containing protein [Candidatus Woesebacteria bacterium]